MCVNVHPCVNYEWTKIKFKVNLNLTKSELKINYESTKC